MPADNIFQQYMQPAKSVLDYSNELDAADLRKQQLIGAQRNNALAGLVYQGQVQDNQAKQSDNALIRSAYGKAAGNQDTLLGLLRGPDATQGTVAHAADVEKSMLDRLKSTAGANKDNAAAGKDQQDTVDKVMARYKGALEGIQNPQQAAQWLSAQYSDPIIGPHIARLGPLADALSRIPTAPAEFQKWIMSAGMGMDKYAAYIKPDPVEERVGDRSIFRDRNANSPTYLKELSSTAIGQTQDNAANNAAHIQGIGMTNATSLATNKATIAGEDRRAGILPDGTISSDMETTAKAIANGQLPAPTGMALLNPRNQRVLARVMEINPQYDATTVSAKKAAATAFTTGQQGNALRSVSTANEHLNQLGDLVDAMDNGNLQIINKVGNYFATQTGDPKATNFNAIKNIVGQEVVKAIVAGGGSSGERDEAAKSFSDASSPGQLKGAIQHYRMVMGAQNSNLLEQRRAAGLPDSTLPQYSKSLPAQSAPNVVTTPDGVPHRFPDAAKAAAFRKEAGL